MRKSPWVVFVLFALLPGLGAAAQRGGRVTLPDGEGKTLVEAVCTTCHQANSITRSVGYDTAPVISTSLLSTNSMNRP